LVRLLPAWVLLAVILVLAPGLPLRVGAAVFQFVRDVTRRDVIIVVLQPTPPPVPPLSPVFRPEVAFWEEDIAVWSQTYQIDPDLIATLMQIESCGDPSVVSPASASGLFQVTSIHFEPGDDHTDPQTNARAGLTFFAYLMELSGGNVGDALAGYNAGEWAVDATFEALPDETQRYVYWGTGIYEEARGGAEESARLNEWLEAGGVRLCEGAAARLGLVLPPTPEAGG
jgi:soluble lytic murein transglycosylase-like protein